MKNQLWNVTDVRPGLFRKLKTFFQLRLCFSEPLKTGTIKCLPARKIEGEKAVKTVLIACPILSP